LLIRVNYLLFLLPKDTFTFGEPKAPEGRVLKVELADVFFAVYELLPEGMLLLFLQLEQAISTLFLILSFPLLSTHS
jgi:hypothetical protein